LIGAGVCEARIGQTTMQNVLLYIGRRACTEDVLTLRLPNDIKLFVRQTSSLLLDSFLAAVDRTNESQEQLRTPFALRVIPVYHYTVTDGFSRRMTHWTESIP
jgi:hypothetical protein